MKESKTTFKCFAFGTMILMGISHWQIIIYVYLFRWKWVDHSHKNIIRMRIKICSNRRRIKRDDNRSNEMPGTRSKLITCSNCWVFESIRPTVNRNKPKPDHFKLDKTSSRCLIELNIYWSLPILHKWPSYPIILIDLRCVFFFKSLGLNLRFLSRLRSRRFFSFMISFYLFNLEIGQLKIQQLIFKGGLILIEAWIYYQLISLWIFV